MPVYSPDTTLPEGRSGLHLGKSRNVFRVILLITAIVACGGWKWQCKGDGDQDHTTHICDHNDPRPCKVQFNDAFPSLMDSP